MNAESIFLNVLVLNVAIYVTYLHRCMHKSSLILVSSGWCDEDENE